MPPPKESLITPSAIDFRDCPAKTFVLQDGSTVAGRSVVDHCQIVGLVAKQLMARYPESLRSWLFPQGADFAAAAHDIGKVSPFFLEKLRRNLTNHAVNRDINPTLEKDWGGHAGVSQLTAQALGAPRYVPEILGQHHGSSPKSKISWRTALDDPFGGEAWHAERLKLVEFLKLALDSDWPTIQDNAQARLVAGLTTVSDWIGSGALFENPALPWAGKIDQALDASGFIPPEYKRGLSFEEVFSFPTRGAQQLLIDQVTGPGVYILEGQMGMGKTEAALYAAYRMLDAGTATGIYFALPTQLTSNKIFERFNDFLGYVLAEDCKHRSLLLHGNAGLLENTDMGEDAKPGGSWFNQSKRGLLAPFAVGTLDQALMAAMNVKHGFVRAFGLAGKVVILDEVHTYDAYTGTLLDSLVNLLRSLHCTVIILSATLNKARREDILGCKLASDAYPLITSAPLGLTVEEHPVMVSDTHTVLIKLVNDEQLTVTEVINRAAAGQQVLWIENTVPEAQQRYLDFAAIGQELGFSCGLLHSKLTLDDRDAVERKWVNLFGKAGHPVRSQQGRILVGTQVLEQSIDIDADFLVSRFAPTDMVLQRIGRLWRHQETPRSPSAKCEAWLLAPALEAAIENPEHAFGHSALVYSPYILCRSLEVWQDVSLLKLSSHIRGLIEHTYEPREESGAMKILNNQLENGTPGVRGRKGLRALRQLARLTVSEAGETTSDANAQTRYSNDDTYEVLLLRSAKRNTPDKLCEIELLSGEILRLPLNASTLSKVEWRKLSAKLMRQIVKVRVNESPLPLTIEVLQRFGFQHCFYLGDPTLNESIMRVALVEPFGEIKGLSGSNVHDKYKLSYRVDLGYQVIKATA
ncbi:CRISPR-associated helicase Cas3' (plasmid) [Pseudomonas silesiensis]|uniref:CRISPR-associated helicase Cas3' n=1 Tax=Pseudomonas silesiensis TaxID=1853130 RepID=UPI0030D4A9BA